MPDRVLDWVLTGAPVAWALCAGTAGRVDGLLLPSRSSMQFWMCSSWPRGLSIRLAGYSLPHTGHKFSSGTTRGGPDGVDGFPWKKLYLGGTGSLLSALGRRAPPSRSKCSRARSGWYDGKGGGPLGPTAFPVWRS